MNDFQPRAGMRAPDSSQPIEFTKRSALRWLIGGAFAATLGFGGLASAEPRKVQRGDAEIEYMIDGRGPTVLMIASLGRPASDFDDLSARLVAAGFTTVRPQPRGIGGSRGPMKGLSLRDLADDAMATVSADASPIVVVGHAFGQRVARMIATRHPERVASVVMLAAGGKAPMRPGAREALLAVFDPKLPPEQHLAAVKFAFFADGNDPAVWRDGWYADTAHMQNEATQAQKVDAWWGGGKAPLLVIQGLQDTVAPPENGRMIVAEFADRATLREIDGAGHALLPERPQQLADLVIDYLRRDKR